ncbi:MAG TPA: saccharopine dehydrogenase NADP-binding domain-containing protein [Tahibacter sp.]|uniref:saccharopine dehydrogenase family protein n=1 Tax=Tahibacter sp. TaxID=2056211 RepID=UPI002CAB01CD|nr:saccharopine dehydrogenase NADP-binding domain-containing protein [Tahibacter sp.]HSX63059.1 saccharopine dehydrogenase NADP-binding domain-containing protein [Tahibacter sp.]
MSANRTAAVFGAYGHTGRFVVAELARRGWSPILCGRDARKLEALGRDYPALPLRIAPVDDPAALDRALDGAVAVINCAGPFLDTATPVIEAALRARIAYLDVSAEQQSVLDTFERHADAAREAGIVVLPGMAFYGGLADLLATAATGDWPQVETIDVAVALDRWHPTAGTRLTGQRNHYRRRVVSDGRLADLANPPPLREWQFPAPFGTQAMVALPFSETITISRHLRVRELHSHLNRTAIEEVRSADTPAPVAVDAAGRSAQRFAIEVRVTHAGQARRAAATGQDIYAITAPLVVEALERIADGRGLGTGALAAGEAFDAEDFLTSLSPRVLERY